MKVLTILQKGRDEELLIGLQMSGGSGWCHLAQLMNCMYQGGQPGTTFQYARCFLTLWGHQEFQGSKGLDLDVDKK